MHKTTNGVLHDATRATTKAFFTLEMRMFVRYTCKCNCIYACKKVRPFLCRYSWTSPALNSIMCRSLTPNFNQIRQ
jgi:hypothetical protein